ncbi:MAG: hypothetical protein Q8Q95_04575 [bacterium]|nr:hypothetical protein [bacterium]
MRFTDAGEFKKETGHEVNGIWFPRVTRILEIKSKPALQNFFKEVGSYQGAEDIKNKSAEEGSLLHQTVQGVLTGREMVIPESIRPAVEKFIEFNQDQKIVIYPEFIEKPIWSGKYRYAGTVDALACIGGKFGVLDIKTSTGFYPEYNLQTSAYVSALQEFEIKKVIGLPQNIETRWILRIDQKRICDKCGASLREKGGRRKIRPGKNNKILCLEESHEWRDTTGEVELREFPYLYKDFRAFVAAKILWEWENDYWLKKVGYLK